MEEPYTLSDENGSIRVAKIKTYGQSPNFYSKFCQKSEKFSHAPPAFVYPSSAWVVCRRIYGHFILCSFTSAPPMTISPPTHNNQRTDFWYSNRYCQHILPYQKSDRWVVRRRSNDSSLMSHIMTQVKAM